MSAPTPAPQRVIAYVDGFNLFFGLKSKGWKQFYWLDVHRAALALLRSGQRLVEVKYFTSRVSSAHGDPAQARRQAIYLEALATLPSVSLYFGHYLSKAVRCHACGAQWQKHDEKMTDVNIATELWGNVIARFASPFQRTRIGLTPSATHFESISRR